MSLRVIRLDERATLTNMAVEAGGFTGNIIVGTDLASLRLPAKK